MLGRAGAVLKTMSRNLDDGRPRQKLETIGNTEEKNCVGSMSRWTLSPAAMQADA